MPLKMKIAFLIGEVHPTAGQTHTIAEIIKYLFSVHPEWEVSLLSPKIYYPLAEGINDVRVKLMKIEQYYSAILLPRNMSEMLKDYDIIYIKGSFPYVFPAVKSGRPTVLVIHQMDSPRLYKGLLPKLRIFAANLITGYTIRKPGTVVTVTDELAAFYSKKYGVNVKVIEDQISDTYFGAKTRVVPDKSKGVKLLTVGYWDGPNGRKRQDLLLRYFAESVKVRPELRLSMVGLSDDNLINIGKLAQKMHLSNYLTMKGFLCEKELMEEYVDNHIYVTATTYEGFYRQIVEAFATGMPAVVYDSRSVVNDLSSSASANHVIKSGAGMLFNDAESFRDSIAEVLYNYVEYSAKAREYALRYSPQVTGPKTMKLLETLNAG